MSGVTYCTLLTPANARGNHNLTIYNTSHSDESFAAATAASIILSSSKTMVSKEEVAEINTYFQNRMAESKKIWATRGKDARIAAAAANASRTPTWRQMTGMSLMMHEISHVMVGFGLTAVITLWIQTKFTDDMRKDSLYWSKYHGAGGGAASGHH